jgi:hypothetical protein
MKINVSGIVRDHFGTLRDARSGSVSLGDIITFFVVPLAFGITAYVLRVCVVKDVYNVSITFFGIFIALLLNIQVAIFGILQRKWEPPSDKKMLEVQRAKREERRVLMSELNANVSYLVLFCCAVLVWFVMLFMSQRTGTIWSAVSIVMYVHFVLTLIMVVKRSHALFQREYHDDPK